jgi:ligand-binding sensor domain-containing protein/serine phosphatase RsbU (regulator of sigma subunit)
MLQSTALFIVISVYVLSQHVNAQSYKFKTFGLQEDICNHYVYTVNQDKNGFIWVGTGEGLCRFNGFEFNASNDSLLNEIVNTSFKDSDGNLWFGTNTGRIVKYDGQTFHYIKTAEEANSTVNAITEYEGTIVAALQSDGLTMIQENLEVDTISKVFENLLISALAITKERTLLIGTMQGMTLGKFTPDKSGVDIIGQIDELAYIPVQSIAQANDDNSYWIGTDGEGFYQLRIISTNEYELIKMFEDTELAYENIKSIIEDKEENLWISTFGGGLYRISKTESGQYNEIVNYNESNGLSTNNINEVFQDIEENIWIATYGKGLEQKLEDAFIFYDDKDISAVATLGDYVYYGGNGFLKKINIMDPEDEYIYDGSNGLPGDKITALYTDKNNNTIWIGTESEGAYTLKSSGNRISSFNLANVSLGKSVNHITGNDKQIWFSTKNGIYFYNPETGEKTNMTTRDGLPHNNISQVFIDSRGRGWLATKSNALYAVQNMQVIDEKLDIKGVELEFTSITEDEHGRIWAATYGNGIFLFSGDSIMNFTTNSGLKSNFCYSTVLDPKGIIWTGHRPGLSAINTNNFIINTYGREEGFSGDFNNNAVSKSDDGIIYLGSTSGMIRYNYQNNVKNDTPPMINIVSSMINDQPVTVNKELVLPYDIYKIQIEFIGLNYKHPEEVTYQYMFEGKGFDNEFSEPTKERRANYNNVRDGTYTFKVKAFNSDGVSMQEPFNVKIRVKVPFWKTWWFIVGVFLLLVGIFYLIIKYRERKQKQLQEYLETQLAMRTKEVVEQKEEIEIKNRDITDSINYAQRIQASILPSMRRLQNNFSGSFVFYLPRDIVSGDFYWFDETKPGKFVIVCADSTGHGVPGAFMSMIGTTLIKDICLRDDVNSPAQILLQLDNELKNTLNQNVEAERSNDGMDIIVCEIDINTNYMRFASAMRPIIIYKDGQEMYLKGSRSSVGGHMHKEQKEFEEVEFQLTKGDIVYMFSDGYPDQFGGPMSKKYKMVRLKKLLENIHQKPMEEQFNTVKSSFFNWMGDNEQVDDVLFMGIKI